MSRVIEVEVFQFDELSDKAKEKARDWYREAIADDSCWSEFPIEDAKEVGRHLGFDVDKVYFTGFWSQGDGACFEGTWRARDVNATEAKAHAPMDAEIERLADAFEQYASANPTGFVEITHRDRYYHEYSVTYAFGFTGDAEENADEEPFIEATRDFMRWIYRRLEEAYERENADDRVDENILINEYEFTADGKRWWL